MGGGEAGNITLGQYLRQLARHQNFLWFVGMDLVQVRGAIFSALLQGCSMSWECGTLPEI